MDINQLQREHKKHVTRIAELERMIAQVDALRQSAVEEATRPLHQLNETLVDENRRLNERWLSHSNELSLEVLSHTRVNEDLMKTIRELQTTSESLLSQLNLRDERILNLVAVVNTHRPEMDEKDKAIADLTALLKKVEGRMKRKELEEQNAILNRKAVAGSKTPEVPVEALFSKARALCGLLTDGRQCIKRAGHSGEHEVMG